MKVYLFDSASNKMYEALRWNGTIEEREAFSEFSGGDVKGELTAFQGKDLYFLKILAIKTEPTTRANCLDKGDWLLRSFSAQELKIIPSGMLVMGLAEGAWHVIVPVRLSSVSIAISDMFHTGQVSELLRLSGEDVLGDKMYVADNLRPY